MKGAAEHALWSRRLMVTLSPPASLEFSGPSIFLAGSIDEGAAEDWQARVIAALSDLDLTVLNPRRAVWDSSWITRADNPVFREQVEWELQGLELASLAAFYFSPTSQAPVTMLELGLLAGLTRHSRRRSIVCCPEGFWRKGNVDVVCQRFGLERVATLEALIEAIRWAVAEG